MSPFCPRCLGLAVEDEKRCPLDQQFLRRRNCSSCGNEIFPREIFCAHCGCRDEKREEVLLLPPEAAPRDVFGSLLLDYVTFGLLIFMSLELWLGALGFLLAPFAGLLYRTLGRSGGRQTFGQTVFHVLTVSKDAGAATLLSAFQRSLLELVYLPLLFFGKSSTVARLDRATHSLEVSLA